MSSFINYGFLNITIVEFDTEDNIYRTDKAPWQQNLNLDTMEPLSMYGFRYYAQHKMWFKSTIEIKSIRLNNFNFKYSVKKVSPFHFEIHSKQIKEYFDGTDNISIIAKFL